MAEEPRGGTLYVVATPLGNLSDLSERTRRLLGAVDVVAAEDTRVTRKLLHAIDARPRLIACHDHNEADKAEEILRLLEQNVSVALVSDAGTPLVADPGFRVVRACLQRGAPVISVPGPSAAVTALVASGLPPDRFAVFGFLPRHAGPRDALFDELRTFPMTSVVYASPHRLLDDLAAAAERIGDRPICAACDLTKRGERYLRGTAAEIRAALAALPEVTGEWTLVIGPAPKAPPPPAVDPARLAGALREAGLSTRAIRDVLVQTLDLPRNDAYALALG